MKAASRRKAANLRALTTEMLVASPQVVAHRLGRIALSGPRPSLKDQREFQRMGTEKLVAFGEAWRAMTLQALKSNQQLAASMMRSAWPAAASRRVSAVLPLTQVVSDWQGAALDILGQGIRPMHRRAVANAKRLTRLQTPSRKR
jgi:hypothetical protein